LKSRSVHLQDWLGTKSPTCLLDPLQERSGSSPRIS